MKSQYTRTIIIELFLIAFSFFHFIFIKQLYTVYYVIELLLLLIILLFIGKIDIKENLQKKEVTQVIIISILVYYILIYLSGLFIGFVYTTYSRSIAGIARNVITSISFVVIIEYMRDIIIKKGRYYKSTVFLCGLIMTVLELLFVVTISNFSSYKNVLEIFLVMICPYLFRNIFLTYCTYYFGRNNSLIYHLLMVVPNYILPIFPNLGDYVNSVLLLLHPLIVLVLTADSVFNKQDTIKDTFQYRNYMKFTRVIYTVIIVFLFIMVYFVSDLGRFTVLAIGSESMHGTIDKGDVVFIDKKIRKYKEGEILAFNYSGTIIVHRIVEVNKDGTYITKGDNNNAKDNWVVKKEMIKGSANYYVKYVGWPTVRLSEILADSE